MDIREIVNRLRHAPGPDAEIDRAIAEYMGHSTLSLGSSSNVSATLEEPEWLSAGGAPTPPYTGSLDHAFNLARQIAPGLDGGIGWENGRGSATIDSGSFYQAASPEIALCIAALMRRIRAV